MPCPTRPEEIILEANFALTPISILAMWAGGMAGGAAFIAYWRIVSRVFFWVTGAATLLVGAWTVGSGGLAAWVGTVALIVGMALTRLPGLSSAAFGVASVAFTIVAGAEVGWLLAVTGAVALGGVTDEMLLGHWYLVDPKLPRWALRALDLAGTAALALDAAILLLHGVLVDGGVIGWAFLSLAAMSILLMVGVFFALREPAYAGVMAATGLSYLAVLTTLGAVVSGRSLLGEATALAVRARVPL